MCTVIYLLGRVIAPSGGVITSGDFSLGCRDKIHGLGSIHRRRKVY